jgi:hypothetical protein
MIGEAVSIYRKQSRLQYIEMTHVVQDFQRENDGQYMIVQTSPDYIEFHPFFLTKGPIRFSLTHHHSLHFLIHLSFPLVVIRSAHHTCVST